MTMFIHFFCLCPLSLTTKLTFIYVENGLLSCQRKMEIKGQSYHMPQSHMSYQPMILEGSYSGTSGLTIGHFRVLLCLCFKTSLCAKLSSACSFILMQIKVIFIRMVSHLDLLCNRGTRELGNGLFCYCTDLTTRM